MTKLEIPEGYSKGTYEVRESAFPCGYLVNAQDGFTEATAQLIALAPAMAEEIKRLREENGNLLESLKFYQELSDERNRLLLMRKNQLLALESELEALRRTQIIQGDANFGQSLMTLMAAALPIAEKSVKHDVERGEISANRKTYPIIAERAYSLACAMISRAQDKPDAALAKPQAKEREEFPSVVIGTYKKDTAEQAALPAGCEPFELERAKVEGARTADGRTWYWDGSSREKDGWCFETKNTPSDLWFFNEQGLALKVNDATPFAILYCIAKPTKTEGGV